MSNQSEMLPIDIPSSDMQGDSFEYQLLVGHRRTDGSPKSTEYLHTEYLRLTDQLVHKTTEGISVKDPDTGEYATKPVDFIVWLDKSARPVQWLFHKMWGTLAAQSSGTIPNEPQHKFVNIDRKMWSSTIDVNGHGSTNVSTLDQSIIRSLRSIFLERPHDREDGLTERIDKAPTQFDGKTVLIVDELISTGRTLTYAENFFKRAFPEANVAGAYWMGGITSKNGAIGNADVPVWYTDKHSDGRGVGDRNIDASLARPGKLSAQRLGAWFLSVGQHGGPDALSRQLRQEIHHLADDARSGRVFIEPSRQRDIDDYIERGLRLNNLPDIEAFKAKKPKS